MGHSRPLLLYFRLFNTFDSNIIGNTYKVCQWLDSNRVYLVSEATALPTASQPLPCNIYFYVVSFQIQANRKYARFRADPNLPQEACPSNEDFWDSGWSRGHMAPAGNNKFSQSAMNDTFYLTNIVPQVGQDNFTIFVYSHASLFTK